MILAPKAACALRPQGAMAQESKEQDRCEPGNGDTRQQK